MPQNIKGRSMASKREVIKASGAIEISNEITLLQRRAWNYLLAHAYNDLASTDIFEIRVKDLAEALGYDSNDQEYIKDSLRALRDTRIEFNLLGKDNRKEWHMYSLLADAVIINGVCKYSYGGLLKQRLNNPAMYARISLSLQNKFTSKHSLALYELAVDYFRVVDNRGETPWISLEKLGLLFAVKADEIKTFKVFNRDVIKKAVKEINSKSDLWIDVEYRREVRKVIAVKFLILHNPNAIVDITPPRKRENHPSLLLPFLDCPDLFDSLTNEFGLSRGAAVDILKSKDEFYVREVLESVRGKIEANQVRDIPAFTMTALQKDFRAKKPAHESKREAAREAKRKAEAAEAKRRAEEAGAIERGKELNSQAAEKYESLTKPEQKEIEKEALKRLAIRHGKPSRIGLRAEIWQVVKERFEIR